MSLGNGSPTHAIESTKEWGFSRRARRAVEGMSRMFPVVPYPSSSWRKGSSRSAPVGCGRPEWTMKEDCTLCVTSCNVQFTFSSLAVTSTHIAVAYAQPAHDRSPGPPSRGRRRTPDLRLDHRTGEPAAHRARCDSGPDCRGGQRGGGGSGRLLRRCGRGHAGLRGGFGCPRHGRADVVGKCAHGHGAGQGRDHRHRHRHRPGGPCGHAELCRDGPEPGARGGRHDR